MKYTDEEKIQIAWIHMAALFSILELLEKGEVIRVWPDKYGHF